jgi:trehalose 6-phosphate synthase/phosphatase
MAQKFQGEGAPLAESPAPLNPDESPDSIHPGQHPSLTEIPVTPGIHIGEYINSRPGTGASGYFSQNPARSGMAQTPTQAVAGAKTRQEVLRRLSLTRTPQAHEEPISELSKVDPRAANPTLALSGNVISATFVIPQSLQWRKGADWVSNLPLYESVVIHLLIQFTVHVTASWDVCPLRLFPLPFV